MTSPTADRALPCRNSTKGRATIARPCASTNVTSPGRGRGTGLIHATPPMRETGRLTERRRLRSATSARRCRHPRRARSQGPRAKHQTGRAPSSR
jgi:hypothetical protein